MKCTYKETHIVEGQEHIFEYEFDSVMDLLIFKEWECNAMMGSPIDLNIEKESHH